MRNPIHWFSLASALVFAGAPAHAAILCVNPASASCEATIQDAVDNAAAGDTINIASGFFNENVVVPGALTGLTLRGGRKTILDGDAPLTGVPLTVNADDVSVRGFAIHNGQDVALQMNGDRGEVRGMTIVGPESDCINVTGDDVAIIGNQLRGCGNRGIEAIADDVDIFGNDISQCDESCIAISGDGFIVERNDVHIAEDSYLIDFSGDDGEIVGNLLGNADSEAIFGVGDDVLIAGNRIHTAAGAIDVIGANPRIVRNRAAFLVGAGEAVKVVCNTLCDAAIISRNRIEHVADDSDGIDASATLDGMEVERNKVAVTEDILLDLSGSGRITARRNKLVSNGGDRGTPCVNITGAGAHLVEDNKIANCHGDGISASGTGHVIDDNDIRDVLEDGIDVDGGTSISVTNNSVRDALGVGLETETSTGTTINDNAVRDVRMALCDESTGTVRMNNTSRDARTADQLNTANACPID